MSRQWQILVVDDEMVMRESLAAWLREDGYLVDVASNGNDAIALSAQKEYAIYFIDLKMPGIDGIETMMEVRRIRPDAAVIIITAFATVDTAITAMKEGAQEYVVKPCNPQEISLLLSRIIRLKDLERENRMLRERLTEKYGFGNIISKNPRMNEIFSLIRDVASLRSTVLIQGESGTGKDLVARAIHETGERADKPYVAVSCAALAETLLESELFGSEKGAFTGANALKRGKFEIADGGTLFLDEIGDISPKLQLDLLRVLQEKAFYRLGGTKEISVDVRVIAATNAPLEQAVENGDFRQDLFYRLNVINIRIPPLRERLEDVPLLARRFMERISMELKKEVNDISEDAVARLMDHPWPGNVRELENAVERAIVTCKNGVLTAQSFEFLDQDRALERAGYLTFGNRPLSEIEKAAIEATLRRTHGNVKAASEILGIDRSTVYEKIKKLGIHR